VEVVGLRLERGALELDLDEAEGRILEFVRRIVRDAGASGVVVGLSGGVDSSLTAALCTKALGNENVLGIIMPLSFTPSEDVDDAIKFAEDLGIRIEVVDIDGICEAFFKALDVDLMDPKKRMPVANIRARVRMVALYYFSNAYGYLVAGTGDRSESLIGYFTKYGDGGVDFLPICHLYKTQVRELARHMGIPERVAFKPSSPQLYPGHKATDEIPIGYEELDLVLAGLFDLGMTQDEVSGELGVPVHLVEEVVRCYEESKHKRSLPNARAVNLRIMEL
jgi:NAD+ synthase